MMMCAAGMQDQLLLCHSSTTGWFTRRDRNEKQPKSSHMAKEEIEKPLNVVESSSSSSSRDLQTLQFFQQ